MSLLDEIRAQYGISRPTSTLGGLTPPGQVGSGRFLDQLKAHYSGASVQEDSNPAARFVNQLPEGLRNTAGGALRGLASSLEPLQLPQDILFSVIAGAADPNTTITERLRGIEWGKYAPWGDAPARPANGEEIFTLLGFDDRTSKWAGIVADITVDPLVLGSWLRVAGKVSALDDLVRLGDRIDNFISPIGLGREVNRIARRSPQLSAFIDTRTDAFMQVFRNPDSTLFGIQRFGEKATNALERVLPRSQVDILRFGRETAEVLADARRQAERVGHQIPEEAISMLWRARRGVEGDPANDLVRTFVRSQEEQIAAWNARLSDLDPTLRDLIEREVYNVVRPMKDRPGIGFLAFVGSREGIEQIGDPQTKAFASELYEALASQRSTARTAGAVSDDFLFEGVQEAVHKKLLESAQEHIGGIARERAQAAGLAGQELANAERRALDSFKYYLADTIMIDAKLGHGMSGMEFIGNQVRKRGFELTGSFEESQNLWQRILHMGLTRGQEGIEELKKSETRINLRNLVSDAAPGGNIARRQEYRERLAAEVLALGGRDRAKILPARAYERMQEIYERAKGLYINPADTGNWRRVAIEGSMSMEQRRTMNAAFDAWESAMIGLREAADNLSSARKFGASNISEADNAARLAPFVAKVHQAEDAVLKAGDNVLAAWEATPAISGGTRIVRTVFGTNPETVAKRKTIFEELRKETLRIQKALRDSQFARSQVVEDVLEARRRVQEAMGIGPAGRAAAVGSDDLGTRVAEVMGQMGPVPLVGRNAMAEDILAARLDTGITLEEAVAKNITFGELLDGTADMQALPLGDFLQGVMNGHMRRAYALFQDTDDFRKYIDNILIGNIIPSRVIDETNLAKNMPGFEAEADMILRYQQIMQRNGRGGVLKRTGVADYLLGNGVAPERVNETLAAMMKALDPDNGNLRAFVDRMNAMIPTYRQQIREREEAIRFIDPRQPRIVDRRFFEEPEALNKEMLEQLGEIAMASASLVESATVAQRVIGRQEMFQNIYQAAKARGLLKSTEFTDQFGVKYIRYSSGEATMGGFGGKWVHPYLFEELRRAATVKTDKIPAAFNRMRALITGGYLASPSVVAANLFGGLYQAATVGINPAVMIRNMIETFQDVDKTSRGYRSALVEEIKRNLDLDLSSLSWQEFHRELKRVNLEGFGLGPTGVRKVFDDVATAYERFLQAPGVGRFRARFAGLEGFQFTENWMKVAGYNEMKRRLMRQASQSGSRTLTGMEMSRIEKEAAEFARTMVFDYSELPSSLDFLKRTGLVLFPGFTYFLAGRTLNAAMRRPGSLAVADRLSEAMANASLNIEEQIMALAGTPDWMKDDQGVPMPFTMRRGPQGESEVSIIPLNQLIPTSTIWDGLSGSGNPWAESVVGLGIYGPFFEALSALVSGDGEAPLTAKYGNRVIDPDARGGKVALDVFRFLYNTLAPSNVKKLITVDMEGQLRGLIPSTPEFFRDLGSWASGDLMETAYTFEESRTRRPDRTWRESVLSALLRSPQVVALQGPLTGMKREFSLAQTDFGQEITMLRRRATRARAEGNENGFLRYSGEIQRRTQEFHEQWAPFLEFLQRYERQWADQRRVKRQ